MYFTCPAFSGAPETPPPTTGAEAGKPLDFNGEYFCGGDIQDSSGLRGMVKKNREGE